MVSTIKWYHEMINGTEVSLKVLVYLQLTFIIQLFANTTNKWVFAGLGKSPKNDLFLRDQGSLAIFIFSGDDSNPLRSWDPVRP